MLLDAHKKCETQFRNVIMINLSVFKGGGRDVQTSYTLKKIDLSSTTNDKIMKKRLSVQILHACQSACSVEPDMLQNDPLLPNQ